MATAAKNDTTASIQTADSEELVFTPLSNVQRDSVRGIHKTHEAILRTNNDNKKEFKKDDVDDFPKFLYCCDSLMFSNNKDQSECNIDEILSFCPTNKTKPASKLLLPKITPEKQSIKNNEGTNSKMTAAEKPGCCFDTDTTRKDSTDSSSTSTPSRFFSFSSSSLENDNLDSKTDHQNKNDNNNFKRFSVHPFQTITSSSSSTSRTLLQPKKRRVIDPNIIQELNIPFFRDEQRGR